MSVEIGMGGGVAVDFKVEGLQESLVRLLEVMRDGVVHVLGVRGRGRLDVDLHVFAQGAGVGVGLGAAQGLAVVGLGGRVDLGVLLPVAAVGESSLAKLTLEWLLTCNTNITQTIITSPLRGGGVCLQLKRHLSHRVYDPECIFI